MGCTPVVSVGHTHSLRTSWQGLSRSLLSQPYRLTLEHFPMSLQGTESQKEQPVGAHPAQQFPPPGRRAMLHHHQQEPHGPGQEEDLPPLVSPHSCSLGSSTFCLLPKRPLCFDPGFPSTLRSCLLFKCCLPGLSPASPALPAFPRYPVLSLKCPPWDPHHVHFLELREQALSSQVAMSRTDHVIAVLGPGSPCKPHGADRQVWQRLQGRSPSCCLCSGGCSTLSLGT